MSWVKEVIHNFTCVFCASHWSIALGKSGDFIVINKEFYCPWCGKKHIYVTDDDFR